MNTKSLVIMITLILVVAGIGVWYFLGERAESYAGPVERVRLESTAQEISTLIWVAENQGYFKQKGLDVTIKKAQSGVAGVDDVIQGNIEIAAASEFVAVRKSFENDDFKIFAIINRTNVVDVVGRKDKGIFQPSDLKGKKIAVTAKSNAEYFLGTFLTFNNLSLEDVEVVHLNPTEVVNAIVAGDVEAAVIWEPHVFAIKKRLGRNAVSWNAQGGQHAYWTLIARNDFIEANPEVIERFLQAMIQANAFLHKSNDHRAKEIVLQRLRLEEVYLDSVWEKSDFLVSLEQALLNAMENQANWLIGNRIIGADKIPNYLDYIYLDALEAVQPGAVTIIR